MAEAARAPRRSGNPAVRAAAGDDVVTSIEKEAADEPITFEFKGEVWEVQDGFRPLRFQRLAERNLLSEALEQALGEEQYLDLEDMIESMTEVNDACQALGTALTPGDQGNSRASRRSSARKRPARR